jgi:hypothetical protein
VFNGEIHLAINDNGEKATRTIESGMIFGFREYQQVSNDFATAKQPNTQVIEIPSFIYREIITQTQLRIANLKIGFLMRFGPSFRQAGLEMI